MSSRLLTCEFMRSTARRSDVSVSAWAPLKAGGIIASESAMPTTAASGVRRSCEIAARMELRRRSDSICTVEACATST